jgi:lipopolysaccharide transport system ATP-binding protein
VSKAYKLGSQQTSLREAISSLPKKIFSNRSGNRESSNIFWALKNVGFEVNKGDILGIIGRNGAGKTTILKILSGVTRPTEGNISIQGKVSALIELGAGFHPDLTGRENIYLNGTILGLRKEEIDIKFQQIVEFAELEPFIDTPVKRYSSGMYARLGFSVAAHTNPDVLLVDEVLSVGDYNFQQKCHEFMHTFVNSGKTTVFVSHNMYAAEQLCNRLIWLDTGQIVKIGNPSVVVQGYYEFLEKQSSIIEEKPKEYSDYFNILQVGVYNNNGETQDNFSSGEDITIEIKYQTQEIVEKPYFCVWISKTSSPEPLFSANMLVDGNVPNYIHGTGSIRCIFRNPSLMPKQYYVWVEVYGKDRAKLLYQWQKVASFRIVDDSLYENLEDKKGIVRFTKDHGSMKIPYDWIF